MNAAVENKIFICPLTKQVFKCNTSAYITLYKMLFVKTLKQSTHYALCVLWLRKPVGGQRWKRHDFIALAKTVSFKRLINKEVSAKKKSSVRRDY